LSGRIGRVATGHAEGAMGPGEGAIEGVEVRV